MKRFVLIFIVLVILIVGGIYFYNQKHVATAPGLTSAIPTPSKQPNVTPTITPQPTITVYCTADDIDGGIMLEPAAGNIYGTLTLRNISGKSCSINGDNYIQPTSAAQNTTITHEGNHGPNYITLEPNQTVYSQVHYPNGPQCNGSTEAKNITFAYQISQSQTVTFEDKDHNMDQSLTACTAADEKTAIEVWGITSAPLH